MALAAPTNEISTSLDYLATSLSECAEVQTMLGVGSAAAALPFIFPTAPDAPADGESFNESEWAEGQPFIALVLDEEDGFSLDAIADGGAETAFAPSGQYTVQFFDSVAVLQKPDENDNLAQIERLAMNRAGQIAKELAAQSGNEDRFEFRRLRFHNLHRAGEGETPTVDDYVSWFFTLTWSAGSEF